MADPAPRARNTVWVECKLPNGIVLYREKDAKAPTGQKVRAEVEKLALDENGRIKTTANVVRLNGANSSRVIGGHGLTEVPADFWEEWLATHQDFEPLKNGMIKAQPTRERAAAQALDEQKMPTGFEPIDPNKPGRGLAPVPKDEIKAAAAMSSY